MEKVKKALNIIGDILLGLIMVIALFGIFYGISSKNNGGVPELFGKSAYAVPTNSMDLTNEERNNLGLKKKDTLHKGDLVFGDSKVSYYDIEEGDIIFFKGFVGETLAIIVHRVVDIGYDQVQDSATYSASQIYFKLVDGKGVKVKVSEEEFNTNKSSLYLRVALITRGDNPEILNLPESEQTQIVPRSLYVAKFTGKVTGAGNTVLFLTSNSWINYENADGTIKPFAKSLYDFSLPIGFGLIIVLPILIYLIIVIIRLVNVVNHNKKVAQAEELATGVASDDVKDAIIAEYLRKQEEEKLKAMERDAKEHEEAINEAKDGGNE